MNRHSNPQISRFPTVQSRRRQSAADRPTGRWATRIKGRRKRSAWKVRCDQSPESRRLLSQSGKLLLTGEAHTRWRLRKRGKARRRGRNIEMSRRGNTSPFTVAVKYYIDQSFLLFLFFCLPNILNPNLFSVQYGASCVLQHSSCPEVLACSSCRWNSLALSSPPMGENITIVHTLWCPDGKRL